MAKKRNRARGIKILSCHGTKIVRYCFMAMAAIIMCSCASNKAQNFQPETAQKIECGFDGLFFSVENVMDEFEVGTSGHYVTYDDADAGMYDEVIRLTPKTYAKVCDAIKCRKPLFGVLKATCPYETVEYDIEEYKPMASANISIAIEDEEVPL